MIFLFPNLFFDGAFPAFLTLCSGRAGGGNQEKISHSCRPICITIDVICQNI